jgi:hypothetical protein
VKEAVMNYISNDEVISISENIKNKINQCFSVIYNKIGAENMNKKEVQNTNIEKDSKKVFEVSNFINLSLLRTKYFQKTNI